MLTVLRVFAQVMNMKMVLAVLALSVLTGCGVTQVQPDKSDRYSALEKVDALQAKAVDLPAVPQIKIQTIGEERFATLDTTGMNQLNAYRQAAKQNTEALKLLLDAHNGLVVQRNLMLENLKLEEERGNYYAERYADTENQRRQQYRELTTELLIHKAVIVFMGIFLVL